MDVLNFIFGSFWHFAGICILLAIARGAGGVFSYHRTDNRTTTQR